MITTQELRDAVSFIKNIKEYLNPDDIKYFDILTSIAEEVLNASEVGDKEIGEEQPDEAQISDKAYDNIYREGWNARGRAESLVKIKQQLTKE